ncbi:MAG: hypothetical protein ACR2M8_00120 [Pyrinomonadaceae bacterium]
MEAHRIETTVQPNGMIILEDLPFDEGKKVEVIVLESTEAVEEKSENPYPLRGTEYKYDDPFGPAVPLEDWEVLK